MGLPAEEAAAETPSTRSSPLSTIDLDERGLDEHDQWEILKTAIPGYENPLEKSKRIAKEQKMAEYTKTVTSSASYRSPADAGNQRCHSCGWVGIPTSWQRCPACNGRDILSSVPADGDMDEIISDHVHDLNGAFDVHQADGDFDPHQADGDISIHKGGHVMPLEYEDDFEDELMDLEEEVEVHVAADTGSCAHVVGPKDLPGSIGVKPPASGRVRNFVGAGGDGIKNHGEAVVQLVLEDGTVVNSTVQVADVVRPLHSVSVICDAAHEMLYTKECGYVVPEGTLSRFLANINVIAKYPRRGGLYVAKMKARRPRPKPAPSAAKPGFTRPGRRS